jgi:uncharacterized membrane protein
MEVLKKKSISRRGEIRIIISIIIIIVIIIIIFSSTAATKIYAHNHFR